MVVGERIKIVHLTMPRHSEISVLSDSEDEVHTPPAKRARVVEAASSSRTQRTIQDLSDSDPEATPVPTPAATSQKPRKRRRTVEERRAKFTDVNKLQILLRKPCYKNCKRKCRKVFQRRENFEQLVKFRKDWSKVHKVDQDECAPWRAIPFRFIVHSILISRS